MFIQTYYIFFSSILYELVNLFARKMLIKSIIKLMFHSLLTLVSVVVFDYYLYMYKLNCSKMYVSCLLIKILAKQVHWSLLHYKYIYFFNIHLYIYYSTGKATIVYDVVKLNQIFEFLQAWFKKKLARRFLFGETIPTRSHSFKKRFVQLF